MSEHQSNVRTLPSTNSIVPNFTRPLDKMVKYQTGPTLKPRPLKQWRKQLNSTNISNYRRAGVGIPTDLPTGTTYLGEDVNNTNCSYCASKDSSASSTGIKEKIIRFNDTNFKMFSGQSGYNCLTHKPYCVACNPETQIIKPASTIVSKTYYSDTKGYMKSRSMTYNQNLSTLHKEGVTYISPTGSPLYPTDKANGPQTRVTGVCIKGCSCNKGCNIKGTSSDCNQCISTQTCPTGQYTTIYKPNNSEFAVQGPVSSSTRMLKLNYDTITQNANSFYMAWGAQGANAGSYQGTSTTPYFLKSKNYICNQNDFYMRGNKRECAQLH
jgi:hypothetical protein